MTLVEDRTHKTLLRFLRKILDVPAGYSKEDLTMFRSIASRQHPSLLPLIEDYLRLAEDSETNVQLAPAHRKKKLQILVGANAFVRSPPRKAPVRINTDWQVLPPRCSQESKAIGSTRCHAVISQLGSSNSLRQKTLARDES